MSTADDLRQDVIDELVWEPSIDAAAIAELGLPARVLAVVPGRCTICVWSPGLDAKGNSLVGTAALDEFTTRTGWSIF